MQSEVNFSYEIRFENQPAATAPAREVVVTDTLDANVDLDMFELTEIAFAHHILPVPSGLNGYETLAPMTARGSNIVVEVKAALDRATRRFTLRLRALDPATGWFSEDPLVGLLYPNDDTGRGQGSVSYLVRPRAGLPSGTRIENRARIVFDYNDPIDTPLVFNTIDSAPPTSTVAPLPAEAGPAILVQWSGQDDAGGSGLASYDVYVAAITNVGQASRLSPAPEAPAGAGETPALLWVRWQERTTATSAWFNGVPGFTYAFYSVARDNVGHEEAAPVTPDTTVFVPTNAPVLSEITNRVADVGNLMLITNTVTGTPVGSFTFSFAPPIPFGVTINPTNGILRWTPDCSQASRTNVVTVVVTDTGNTNIYDMMSFNAVVGECVVPGLGRLVLAAGDSGRVPVNLISTVPLTNLSMTVETAAGRLTNLSVEVIVPEVCSSGFSRLGEPPEGGTTNAYLLSLTTCANQFFIGTQQVAWLHFTAVSNQSSTFVPLLLDNTVGRQPDGTEVRNFAPQSGRVVIVGEEPLLEAFRSTNGLVQAILYALPGTTNALQTSRDMQDSWQLWQRISPTNLFQVLPPLPATNQTLFLRALRE